MTSNVQFTKFTSCRTYRWCEESLLTGWLGAGPEAGVMGWDGVRMEWEVSTGEVRRGGWTWWSGTFRTPAAAFTVTAAVAAAGRRCRWHLQHLRHSIHTCHSNRQSHTNTINVYTSSVHSQETRLYRETVQHSIIFRNIVKLTDR